MILKRQMKRQNLLTARSNLPRKLLQKGSSMNMTSIYLVIVVIALAAVGFVGFKFLKKGQRKIVVPEN